MRACVCVHTSLHFNVCPGSRESLRFRWCQVLLKPVNRKRKQRAVLSTAPSVNVKNPPSVPFCDKLLHVSLKHQKANFTRVSAPRYRFKTEIHPSVKLSAPAWPGDMTTLMPGWLHLNWLNRSPVYHPSLFTLARYWLQAVLASTSTSWTMTQSVQMNPKLPGKKLPSVSDFEDLLVQAFVSIPPPVTLTNVCFTWRSSVINDGNFTFDRFLQFFLCFYLDNLLNCKYYQYWCWSKALL